jgi:hypothetical protein
MEQGAGEKADESHSKAYEHSTTLHAQPTRAKAASSASATRAAQTGKGRTTNERNRREQQMTKEDARLLAAADPLAIKSAN